MKTALRKYSAVSAFLLTSFAPTARVQAQTKAVPRSASYLVYVGTYTVRDSKGIYVYRFQSGRLTPLGPLAVETVNPSFLAVDPSHRFLYAVNETQDFRGQKTGAVSAFAIHRNTGRLTLLSEISSGGTDPCYVSLDRTGKYVLVANYSSGSVAVFPVLPGGGLDKASAFVQHQGHSVDLQRQEGPHAHDIAVSPDNRFALAADLGVDKLLVYRFDAKAGSLVPNDPPSASVNPGSGPRHFVFDPSGKFVYLLNEIKSSVTTFSYNGSQGTLHELQTVPGLPPGFTGENTAAEIAMGRSGKFVYASNRGEDAIAVFAIDPAKHTLKSVEHVPTLGKEPRNFAIDPTGAYLLAANQNSDNIVVFQVNPATGELTPTGQVVEVPSPVCVVFVPAE
ncbi:MAG TPA: lactonase family protein [Terriglobia bacterium]